jgi:acyl-homoserine lactone acylase PvdQ
VEIEGVDFIKNAEGSNSWAISGKYTESGRPILATDPHLSNNIPSQWYQYQGCYFNN